MKKRINSEVIFNLDSEGILLHQTVSTQHLRVHLIWTGSDITTHLHLLLSISGLLRILPALVVHHTFIVVSVLYSDKIVETGSQLLSFLRVHLELDIEIHLSF